MRFVCSFVVISAALVSAAVAQDYSSLHGPAETTRGYVPLAPPLFEFRHYSHGIPKPGANPADPKNRYDSYYPYNSYKPDYRHDRYNPQGRHKYPVR